MISYWFYAFCMSFFVFAFTLFLSLLCCRHRALYLCSSEQLFTLAFDQNYSFSNSKLKTKEDTVFICFYLCSLVKFHQVGNQGISERCKTSLYYAMG